MKFFFRRLNIVIPFLTLLSAITLGVFDPADAIQDIRYKVFDYYQRLSPRVYEPVPVRYIDIDDDSLEKIGQWPWPRTVVAELVARLANAGAASVAFDIVFAERDRTSPEQVLPLWPDTEELSTLKESVKNLPDHDDVLSDIISQANIVTGFVLTPDERGRAPLKKSGVAFAGDNPIDYLPQFIGAVHNLDNLEEASAGNGSFNLIPDQDSVIRRTSMLFRYKDDFYPSLGMEALRIALGASTYIVKSSGASQETSFGAHTGINNIKLGNYIIPTTAQGEMWIHYTEDVPERSLSAWRVFAEDYDPSLVEGNIIFVGTSAAGLKDLRVTPLNPVAPGVEVHLQLVEQILLEHFLQRPDWAQGVEFVYLFIFGLILIFLIEKLGALSGAIVTASGIGIAVGVSWQLYTKSLWLLDPVLPSMVILTLYLTGTMISYMREESEKRQVRGAFSQYLSPALVEQLAEEPDRLKLGGETRDMTFLFCDIRGFTPISESFKGDPQGLTSLINRFLTPMTNVILDRQGTIDKYMGDCIMAFWNAPLDVADHPQHACGSALEMLRQLTDLNAEREAESKEAGTPFLPINVGIGINSGDCVVGNMGSDQRFDYSVLGDPVNLAARLEGQSKNYGVLIVLGANTYNDVKSEGYACLELDLIAVKGKSEAVKIYCLLGEHEMAEEEWFKKLAADHATMIECYRNQEWDNAMAAIRTCTAQLREEVGNLIVLYDLYMQRIDEYMANPPSAEWDGVFVATSK